MTSTRDTALCYWEPTKRCNPQASGRETTINLRAKVPHVSAMEVDVRGFVRLLEDLDLRHTQSQLVLIDEIGKMKCRQILARDEKELRCWSLGCASGEEAYSLSLLWTLTTQSLFPTVRLVIVATDIDEQAIARAQ